MGQAFYHGPRMLCICAAACFLIIVSAATPPQQPHAVTAATPLTFYVDNQPGSNCSDQAAGTSVDQPWCDFTPVNSRTFGPGERILLARGATWDQQLTLNGTGAATLPISLDAYGVGPRPRIIRDGNEADRAVRMYNPSYWDVSNLEVGSAGAGILIYYDTLFHQGLAFSNILVHDIRGIHHADTPSAQADRIYDSGGIEFTGLVTATADQYVLKDVTLDDIEGTHNMESIAFDWFGGVGTSDGGDGSTLVKDVTLSHLYLHDDNGPGGCDDGITLADMSHVTVLDSIFVDEGSCYSNSGTAAVFFGRLQDLSVINSIELAVPSTGSADETGFDYEALTDQVRILNSYIASNAGAGIEFLAIHGSGGNTTNSEVAGNTFSGDGNGAILRYLSESYPTGTIRDNLYDEPAGFLTSYGADFSAFTVTNNISVPIAAVSNGAHDFDGDQGANHWGYQYSADGTTWADLTFDQDARAWTAVGGTMPSITQFDQQPGPCPSCAVARTWTAPITGTVTIRGRALLYETGAAGSEDIRITRNGVTVWGPQTLATGDPAGLGMETDVDALSVVPGDVIRFVGDNGGRVSATPPIISWDPTVAYIPANGAAPTPTLGPSLTPTLTPIPMPTMTAIPSATPTSTATAIPTETAVPTDIPGFLSTATPTLMTAIPNPTSIPLPAATPTRPPDTSTASPMNIPTLPAAPLSTETIGSPPHPTDVPNSTAIPTPRSSSTQTAVTPTVGAHTVTPTPSLTSCRAAVPLTIAAPRRVRDGRSITIHIRTALRASVTLELYLPDRHVHLLASRWRIVRSRDRITARARVTARAKRPLRGALRTVAHLGCAQRTRVVIITIQPGTQPAPGHHSGAGQPARQSHTPGVPPLMLYHRCIRVENPPPFWAYRCRVR